MIQGQQPHSSTRRVARTIYLIVCNTLLLLLALEIAVRLVRSAQPPDEDRAATSPDDVPYSIHPFFQTVYPPEPGTINEAFLGGWRSDPPAARRDGRAKILFLGGSTTASLYPHYVREKLESEIGAATAYNLGYDWHCSLHSLYKFWTYSDVLAPDLVVVLDNINDFYRGFTPPQTSLSEYRSDYSHYAGGLHPFLVPGRSRRDGRPVFFARPAAPYARHEAHDESIAGLCRSLLEESSLLRAVSERFVEPETPPVEIVSMPAEVYLRSLVDFKRNTRNLALGCATAHVPVLFLTMPFTTHSAHAFLPPGNFFTNDGVHHLADEDFECGMRAFNDAVVELADEPRAFVLDLAASISDPQLFVDEVHLSDEGLILEAVIVARSILDRGMLARH